MKLALRRHQRAEAPLGTHLYTVYKVSKDARPRAAPGLWALQAEALGEGGKHHRAGPGSWSRELAALLLTEATHWSQTACLQKCGPGSEGAFVRVSPFLFSPEGQSVPSETGSLGSDPSAASC